MLGHVGQRLLSDPEQRDFNSVSSGTGRPVVPKLSATGDVSDQRRAISAMASGRREPSSGSGCNACSDLRASRRLSLACAPA